MCLELFESIKIENGRLANLHYHQLRMSQNSQINLYDLAAKLERPNTGLYKWRLVYKDNSVISSSIMPYKARDINTLRIVECNNIDYGKKFNDRSLINTLFEQRAKSDDILILKNNFITDTSYSNILFHDGNKWFTPSTPLLEGTCRARLLKDKVVEELRIQAGDLFRFKKFMLVNAMMDFSEERAKPIAGIFFKS